MAVETWNIAARRGVKCPDGIFESGKKIIGRKAYKEIIIKPFGHLLAVVRLDSDFVDVKAPGVRLEEEVVPPVVVGRDGAGFREGFLRRARGDFLHRMAGRRIPGLRLRSRPGFPAVRWACAGLALPGEMRAGGADVGVVGRGLDQDNAPVEIERKGVDEEGEARAAIMWKSNAHAKPLGLACWRGFLHAIGNQNGGRWPGLSSRRALGCEAVREGVAAS